MRLIILQSIVDLQNIIHFMVDYLLYVRDQEILIGHTNNTNEFVHTCLDTSIQKSSKNIKIDR